MSRYTAGLAVTLAGVMLAAGCTSDPRSPERTPSPAPPTTPDTSQAVTARPAAPTSVVEGTGAAELALATSLALYRRAPAVVLANEDDETAIGQAASTSLELGVPMLLAPPSPPPASPAPASGSPAAPAAPATSSTEPTPDPDAEVASAPLRAELSRLAATTLVTIGEGAARWARGADLGTMTVAAMPSPAGDAALPVVRPPAPLDDLLVLALDEPASRAATATAHASGARVVLVPGPDPRTDDGVIKALASQSTAQVVALGSAFGPADRLRRRIDTAATGVLLPGGGQVLFPGRRFVALYGHPGDPGLGVLGEQSPRAAVTRAQKLAASYSSLVDEPVVPTFEIIATVAASAAGSDGNYSNESSIAHLRPWVDAARDGGVYVVLDLQPGLTDFLTQAKRYTQLLRQPHVGLALDPEWRLKPGQRHLEQIGTVSVEEINATAAWLAELTRQHQLPQKVLMLHQFRLDMITNRAAVNTTYDELKVVIHADGFGTAGQKFDTWRNMHRNPPPDVWWGWKNFYDEDRPTFTPRQTYAVRPAPVFVSYQ